MKNKVVWIMFRNGEVINTFHNRKKAISYLKQLLNQTLKDLDEQDKIDTYNYTIKVSSIEIKPIEKREAYLGL